MKLGMARGIGIVAALAGAVGCESDAPDAVDPPTLTVTSPQRALLRDHAGAITVTGTVAAAASTASPIDRVTVNGAPAPVAADGSFTAVIAAGEGFTQIHTVAHAANGGEATDTRAVIAGELRKPGTNIDRALTAAISADAFAKISVAAGTMMKQMDVGALARGMNPVQHAGDSNGEDCLFDRVYVDDLRFSDVKIALAPAQDAIDFTVELDGLDTPGHARYALACVSGTESWRITADRVVVSGQLVVTPNGMAGFDTHLVNPYVDITGLNIDASGIPGDIIDMMDLSSTIEWVVEQGAELAMGPVMNQALGGLAGVKHVSALGQTLDVTVAPSAIALDPSGGVITLDTAMLIEGAANSPGYVYTDNGMPHMDAGHGFQLGIADDLANELMAQVTALGLLSITQPSPAGTFDSTKLELTLPPMISADPTDGTMRVMIGDASATFLQAGVPAGHAAVNATMAIKITPANGGAGIAVTIGDPEVEVDVLDDVPNETHFTKAQLAHAVALTMKVQLEAMGALLSAVPLPQIAGMKMRDLSVGGDDGYVMVQGNLQ